MATDTNELNTKQCKRGHAARPANQKKCKECSLIRRAARAARKLATATPSPEVKSTLPVAIADAPAANKPAAKKAKPVARKAATAKKPTSKSKARK